MLACCSAIQLGAWSNVGFSGGPEISGARIRQSMRTGQKRATARMRGVTMTEQRSAPVVIASRLDFRARAQAPFRTADRFACPVLSSLRTVTPPRLRLEFEVPFRR